ncbi:hypothetical protein ABO04_03295 [Nitrosomonas sp. HPC101]|nr:hypothetical protein [Nitrosomonas sp. HPC101]
MSTHCEQTLTKYVAEASVCCSKRLGSKALIVNAAEKVPFRHQGEPKKANYRELLFKVSKVFK